MSTRRERREADLAERRERRQRQRQRRHQPAGGLPLLPISLGVLAVSVVAVLVYAFIISPPAGPTADLRSPTQPKPYALADDMALGAANAPVTIEIWSDYQCPACGTLATAIEPRLVADYVEDGRVRLVYRDFAFLGQESTDAAIGARCAARENRYWQFHDYLFANQGSENRGAYSPARLEMVAQSAGLNLEAYRACRADAQVRAEVTAETQRGQQLGITSTPTMLVGDQPLVGVPRYEALAELLDGLLEAESE